MKRTAYSREVVILVLFNAVFVIVSLVLMPILKLGMLPQNIILGVFTALDAGLFLRIILKPEKIDKASGTLLLISFAAVFTVVFKWVEDLI